MKHFLTLKDFTANQIREIIDLASEIKQNPIKYAKALEGKTLAMLFQKTSTRTRCSFETGMTKLGGHAIYLDWRTTNFTLGSLKDEIKCLSRYSNVIMARVYKHEDLKVMAESSKVPIINGLCDKFHPCQTLADLLTINEKFGKLEGLKIAYVGDGNNVCNSLIIGCTKIGMKMSIATPEGYEPMKEVVEEFKPEITSNPEEAAKNANVCYTDTWVSMGQESEKEKKLKDFQGFQVTQKLLGKALFMHCLPAHRGLEVSDEVLDSKNSIVYTQAENRMWAQAALILWLLKDV